MFHIAISLLIGLYPTIAVLDGPLETTTTTATTTEVTECPRGQYLCPGTSTCIYNTWACDGITDCDDAYDEEYDACGAACDDITSTSFTSTSFTSTSFTSTDLTEAGTIACGQSYTQSSAGSYRYEFTTPNSNMMVKLSNCNDESTDSSYFSLCEVDPMDSDSCVYSSYDYDCGCIYRELMLFTAGTDLQKATLHELIVYASGSGYVFTVECASSLSGGGTCSGDTDSTTSNPNWWTTSSYYYYGYPEYAPSTTTGALVCGEAVTGTTQQSSFQYTFTTPSAGMVKISACSSDNDGSGWFTFSATNDESKSVSASYHSTECGCVYRPYILAEVGTDIDADTQYTLIYSTYFSGSFSFSVECSETLEVGGFDTTCTESNSYPGSSTTGSPWWYSYTDTTNSYNMYGSDTTAPPTCNPTLGPITPTAPTTKKPSTPTTKSPASDDSNGDDDGGDVQRNDVVGFIPNGGIYGVLNVIVLYKLLF